MSSEMPQMPVIPPNTFFLSVETNWHEVAWLHGTRSSTLTDIQRRGILPRRHMRGQGNWKDHPSSREMVYLTTAYALHYARACEAPGLAAILELDLSRLPSDRFFADEDSYALSRVEGMEHLQTLPLTKRVAYWRNNLHQTDPEVSLQVLGSATFKGIVPADAIKKVRLLTDREALALTLRVADPVVNPQNFRLMGGASQRFHRWLMGYQTDLNDWFDSVCKPAIPLMSLGEAAAYAAKSD